MGSYGIYKFKCTCRECGAEFLGRTMFVSNCSSRCRVRAWRRTEQGRACVVKSNKRVKRPGIKKVCLHCKGEFVTARVPQGLCINCAKERGPYYSQKRYRLKNLEKCEC